MRNGLHNKVQQELPELTVRLGQRAEVDFNVMLGYTYPHWSKPTVIGDDAVIRSGSVIYADTIIGHRFTCGHNVTVRAETIIGNDVVLLHQTTLEGKVRIGNGVKIMAHVYIPSMTTIGNFVFIGPGVNFLNAKYPMRQDVPVQGAHVEDAACIGGGVTICPGVTIGKGALIGAGAVVNKDIPPHTLAYGVPARTYPLPDDIPEENLPELLLSSSDLWGRKAANDESSFPHRRRD
ncbi:MAG TPA: acyltransferase [Planctomicrobium sp.]|nr:acyltransferase [Planctomicrobium sp.]